ncbi:MAG: hypothetical protein RR925_02730 [Erysipelotrichaceae bacterium]
MKDSIITISVNLAKRKTAKQKDNFIKYISNILKEKNISVKLQETKSKLITNKNIVIGNLKSSKVLIVSSYDTGSKMLFKSNYFPINSKKNKRNEIINMLLYALLCLLCISVIFLASFLIKSNNIFIRISGILVDLGFLLLLYMAITMPSCRFNMSRNSAAVALIYKLSQKKSTNCAYAYIDNSTTSNLGLNLLSNEKSLDKKDVIILDSLADGENVYVIFKSNNILGTEIASLINGIEIKLDENEILNSPLSYFKNTIIITSGTYQNGELFTENQRTKMDYKVNVKRLEFIEQQLDKHFNE